MISGARYEREQMYDVRRSVMRHDEPKSMICGGGRGWGGGWGRGLAVGKWPHKPPRTLTCARE